MKKALLYQKFKDLKVRCRSCSHYCLISLGQRGICRVKENIKGDLYSLNYSKIVAMNIDPIEKKPFFHFLPGSKSLSIASAGCNFNCLNCQNFNISKKFKSKEIIPGEKITAKKIIEIALENKLSTISYTYSEPTIFLEYALEVINLARKNKIKNIFVSNGFFSKESLKLIIPYLDAINIDIKSFSNDFYKKICQGQIKPVLESAKLIKKSGIWLELTTLIIPGFSDSEENLKKIARFIKEELGKETPWHISAFFGAISRKMNYLPNTSPETLEMAYKIGKKAGLEHVYTGNIPGLVSENTFCPKCNSLAIERIGYSIFRHDKNGLCSRCAYNLNIILK